MLSEEAILDIAEASGKNPTQRNVAAAAIRAALSQLPDTPAVAGGAPEGTVGDAIPTAPVLICVASGMDLVVRRTPSLPQGRTPTPSTTNA